MSKYISLKDVYNIKSPAYVVKERKDNQQKVIGGCVVAWNEEFGKLTNYTPEDIDYTLCHNLFCGVSQDEKSKKWKDECKVECEIRARTTREPNVIRDFCIRCKDQRGNEIVKRVDAFIFPFKTEDEKGQLHQYTLHLLIDKQRANTVAYFVKSFLKGNYNGDLYNVNKKEAQKIGELKENVLKDC